MSNDTVTAERIVDASAEIIFATLADPTIHHAIDGTGWVRESIDGEPLAEVGQIFRMAMYHSNYGGMHYQVANRVEIFDPPNTIAWLPGQDTGDGSLDFGGWYWRYDLEPVGKHRTRITLTYDWSAVPQAIREHIGFPPFAPQHLDNSLEHLAELVTLPAPHRLSAEALPGSHVRSR
ncbi:polyketide cyclase [Mycobacterium sp. SWH-M5]|uniref:SRPBCC family protein n=1 Tax=Mycolicibacterium goodii TaxID=134601 RepID=UPI0009403E55|nr:SRPBCC family protein [Mycolicibacterium goodii]OKH61428.1 polyketide cyclase [Mycobacterium sp. SWH-M5]